VFHAILGLEPAYVDMADPGVNGMEGADDEVVEVFGTATEEVGKRTACKCDMLMLSLLRRFASRWFEIGMA
jgi:hypothetical protein